MEPNDQSEVAEFGSQDSEGDAVRKESELQAERDEHNERRLNPQLPDPHAVASKPDPVLADPGTQTFLGGSQPKEAAQAPDEAQEAAQGDQEASDDQQETTDDSQEASEPQGTAETPQGVPQTGPPSA